MAKGKKVGQGKARPKDKGKGKETKTLLETQGPEDASKAKVADRPVSHPASKKDPLLARA